MADEQQPLETYTPRDGEPGPKELEHRREEAQGILKIRGLQLAPSYEQLPLIVSAIATMLKHRGLIAGDAELQYWVQVAEVESLEKVVEESTEYARGRVIHLPGRQA